MSKMKFTARSKRNAMKYFTLCVTGEIKWGKGETPTKTEIVNHIKEMMAKEWTKGSYHFTPDDVAVKLGA